ncbi:hypothetical protein [Actinacidiphila yeochonensis]|uniref:hypothetical protein n=1 Tax=Actinacidiphila yeochonensis TaxID=89050 RepID=UPI00056877D7|nr:hypothetical protein [Actinacidiphila yeochonensis]
MAGELGEAVARTRAAAVLRVRGSAVALALLPAAAAVVLHAGRATGRWQGQVWDGVRWGVSGAALVVLAVAAGVAAVVARARPAVSPTVRVAESSAPDLYLMVRDLADRLQVPAPSAIELTPDCDSWLEQRAPAHPRGGPDVAPVLVIGSPFLWWMRVPELRALLAPVVAGTAPAADPGIAAARRFVRGLDAAAAVAARRTPSAPGARPEARASRVGRALLRPGYAVLGAATRLMLSGCRAPAAEMERGVAASASERAQAVDYGLRIVAQEQVGLAYAGWDRLLTRVALPAWRLGRWPSRLDAGVVAALTELSRRDRLAEGFESRLGERPACDLLEEPGTIDEAVSLLAARIFHGGPARQAPGWQPVAWAAYPEEVVDRLWRTDAARLVRLLDEVRPQAPGSGIAADAPEGGGERLGWGCAPGAGAGRGGRLLLGGPAAGARLREETGGATLGRVLDQLAAGGAEELAGRIAALTAREEAARLAAAEPVGLGEIPPLLPPRTGRELLADHVVAVVCCAAVDTAGATAGMDWLDGPVLLLDGARCGDLSALVLRLTEEGDPTPLRRRLVELGVRAEKPLRLA